RPRLSRHRTRALLAEGAGPGRVRVGDRQRGARRPPAAVQARRHHPRARARPCLGPCHQARARAGQGQSAGDESLRPRRQGCVCRGRAAGHEDLTMSRIARRFAQLKADKRAGLVTYVSAGDPDVDISYQILKGLPGAGADLIELGMPFTDPMADGPSIQLAGQRALKAGITVDATFDMVRRFRKETGDNPPRILLMGYYNLVYQRGVVKFCKDAAAAGVDGFILVDLPPEEADELKPHALANGLDTVLLTAPTTDDKRLPAVLKYSSGFVYIVSVLGITGTKSATEDVVRAHVERIKRHTKLP